MYITYNRRQADSQVIKELQKLPFLFSIISI